MRWQYRAVVALGMIPGLWSLADAAESPADLQKGVAAAVQKFEQAFEQRDAKALAGLFTEEGEYVDAEGVVFHGRQVIANEFAAAFQVLPPGSMKIEVLSIRPVAQGVLVEDGVSTFVPKDPGTSSKTRFTATHVRQADGTWLRASVRELSAGDATPQEHLKALSWLLGAWRQESDSGKVDTEWKLSEDKSFLIGHFHSEQPRAESQSGTHRVGWDAERGQFKSWVFTSSGGFAEGYWTVDARGQWSVRLDGVDPDGQRMSTVVSYVRDGADAMVISQGNRTLGTQSMPTVTHRVVRQPPAPARAKSGR